MPRMKSIPPFYHNNCSPTWPSRALCEYDFGNGMIDIHFAIGIIDIYNGKTASRVQVVVGRDASSTSTLGTEQ